MAETITNRLKHAWNAFMNRDPTPPISTQVSVVERSSSFKPDRPRMNWGAERSIISAIYTKIAVDCSKVDIRHVKVDDNGHYASDIDSTLNYCLNTEANRDQTGREFIRDAAFTLLDQGHIAIVPFRTDVDPELTDSYKILEMKVGQVIEWRPTQVKVRLYNEDTMDKEEIFISKRCCALVENPFYAVMNSPNSTMQRLIRKLSLLDSVDEENNGKLQMIIQLPYIIKSEARKQQAEMRRHEIEKQLTESKYGIAYTDGTEKITTLGRPLENNLQAQIEYLTNMLYGQLGMTPEILNGTASESEMLNYMTRVIEVIVQAITEEMERKFLSKTARTQKQAIRYFHDRFSLVPMSQLAELADKLTRNEIMTSNEVRQTLGMKPSSDPKADQLVNSNMPYDMTNVAGAETGTPDYANMDPSQMSDEELDKAIAEIDKQTAELDRLEAELDGT
ncbi:MAG: phage portal protein [Clostridiales bacterium]|nr:phage portal protein [Clostridiales bacterium]